MFVNTQMLNRAQLAKMQAMFIYLAVDNFKDQPTADKFIKLMDETREYLSCIDRTSTSELTSFVKEGFDLIQRAAVSCADCSWNDFPISGIEAMAAMACNDFLPDVHLRMIFEQKKREFNMDSFQLSLVGLFKSLEQIYDWFEKNGYEIKDKFNLEIASVKTSGERHDN